MVANAQFAGSAQITESPEELIELRKIEEREVLLGNRNTSADLKALGEDLYGEGHICSPEEKENNAEQFIQRYAPDLELLLSPELALEIGKEFEKNGDIEASIFIVLTHLDTLGGEIQIPLENVEAATEQVVQYLDPRVTSIRIDQKLRNDQGIKVQAGMNTSFIAALSGSNREFNFNAHADKIQAGDTLAYGENETDLMRNDTQIGELQTPDEGIPELIGTEFMESRYAPIITNHQDSSSDPLKNISSQQVQQISDEYASGTDIVEAMQNVLGHDHEAVGITKNLDNPDKINERRSQMYKDLGVESKCRIDPNTGEGGDTITNLISENYTRIIGSDGELDSKASVILATQVSANKIIEGKHTFTRTEKFSRALERIQEGSTSPEELKTDLLDIYTIVNNGEGIRGKSKQNENQRLRKTAEQKSLFLQAEFLGIQALFLQAQKKGDNQGVEDQREAAKSLEQENKGGEVTALGGGDLDFMAQLDDAMQESA